MSSSSFQALSQTLTRRLIFLALIFWLPILAFIGLANVVHGRAPLLYDSAVLTFLQEHRSPGLTGLFSAFTLMGGPGATTVIVAGLTWAFFTNGLSRRGWFTLVGVGGAVLINLALKLTFKRSRPDLWSALAQERTYSFPSGHAMASSALALTLVILCWPTRYRWWVVAAALLYTGLVGVSRLYLGVHFPSDVLGGWLISIAWITLVYALFRRHQGAV